MTADQGLVDAVQLMPMFYKGEMGVVKNEKLCQEYEDMPKMLGNYNNDVGHMIGPFIGTMSGCNKELILD